MSHPSAVKTSDPAIRAYHAVLKTFAEHRAGHEGAVETALSRPLADTAKPHGWTLICHASSPLLYELVMNHINAGLHGGRNRFSRSKNGSKVTQIQRKVARWHWIVRSQDVQMWPPLVAACTNFAFVVLIKRRFVGITMQAREWHEFSTLYSKIDMKIRSE